MPMVESNLPFSLNANLAKGFGHDDFRDVGGTARKDALEIV